MSATRIPQKGDIWHFSPDPVFGRELQGDHYGIVVTEGALNAALGVAICCPISTKAEAARSSGVTVVVTPVDTERGDLRGVVLCHQAQAIDLIARGATFETVAEDVLIQDVIIKLINLIDPQ
ncbi:MULTISPECIES: type II toxin-antitoxin system PemK/MazF family toxin [Pectobacterium]|uniref:Growth inhibitor PemK n=2 Tax=Pectobacterium TaxID=122277 RepID=A0AAW3EBH4_9GAMM|nr:MULTISPECIES: type II toxin-antitoxin system PemK/MazF family toxin [Pectobacterium]GKW11144.1 mRNA interferase PemK [Pectobacterium carotovorum subsp. carotovorum]AOR63584.1 growth inhibitor PemK [Pectobacterium wasabiae CFBP 3304]EJS93529.1 ChpB [Pectobacterium wasabiae CFBP 3304]KFX02674.1 growth inhibitor PemK [Pectobacterium wasabiae]KGA26563.1 growth inhibitor PemK [Pectobacterium wasabiae]